MGTFIPWITVLSVCAVMMTTDNQGVSLLQPSLFPPSLSWSPQECNRLACSWSRTTEAPSYLITKYNLRPVRKCTVIGTYRS
ncbi:hypothetical protein M758_10G178700 [Ceratodon purpureus]|uniref:Uncharacterized protein n=1 Tax=Ceratodon purpureus TaxID=3225 RepID=A0A8T0GN89_CERPU|nr:hypothetical protein KC19_10G183700 [Ceratodon purpureus]KAG0604540.1 hypothetical protein M758_10G178700 [Ceratodon purpureus]